MGGICKPWGVCWLGQLMAGQFPWSAQHGWAWSVAKTVKVAPAPFSIALDISCRADSNSFLKLWLSQRHGAIETTGAGVNGHICAGKLSLSYVFGYLQHPSWQAKYPTCQESPSNSFYSIHITLAKGTWQTLSW